MDGADETGSQDSICLLEISRSSSRRNSCSFTQEDRGVFTNYRENGSEESRGSLGSLHSVHQFEGETPPLQKWLDSNSRGGEGTSTSYFAQLGSVV